MEFLRLIFCLRKTKNVDLAIREIRFFSANYPHRELKRLDRVGRKDENIRVRLHVVCRKSIRNVIDEVSSKFNFYHVRKIHARRRAVDFPSKYSFDVAILEDEEKDIMNWRFRKISR